MGITSNVWPVNELDEIVTEVGTSGTQGLSTIGSVPYNTLQTSKLYVGVQLGLF